MKQKIIQSIDIETYERMIEAFNNDHDVKATQTHINMLGSQMIYTAFVFYEY